MLKYWCFCKGEVTSIHGVSKNHIHALSREAMKLIYMLWLAIWGDLRIQVCILMFDGRILSH
jgi:hypothetical protein